MESTGVPGRIQVSQAVIESIPESEFSFERRGMVNVKGIGEVETFFLNERVATTSEKYWWGIKKRVQDGTFRRLSQTLELLRQET